MLKQDLRTDIWKRFQQVARTRIDELRQQNDRIELSPEETAAIRGRIAELKRLLDLEDYMFSSSATNVTPGTAGDDFSEEGHA